MTFVKEVNAQSKTAYQQFLTALLNSDKILALLEQTF